MSIRKIFTMSAILLTLSATGAFANCYAGDTNIAGCNGNNGGGGGGNNWNGGGNGHWNGGGNRPWNGGGGRNWRHQQPPVQVQPNRPTGWQSLHNNRGQGNRFVTNNNNYVINNGGGGGYQGCYPGDTIEMCNSVINGGAGGGIYYDNYNRPYYNNGDGVAVFLGAMAGVAAGNMISNLFNQPPPSERAYAPQDELSEAPKPAGIRFDHTKQAKAIARENNCGWKLDEDTGWTCYPKSSNGNTVYKSDLGG